MAEEEQKAGSDLPPVEPDESSLKGKGWDILAGGRGNAEVQGGDDPFNLQGDPIGFSAAAEVEQVIPAPASPASSTPASEAFWDRGRGTGEGGPPPEPEGAIEAPPRELSPEELGALPLGEPAHVHAEAVVIELRALADEASEPAAPEPVLLAEPEPEGVMDTPEPIKLDEPEPGSGPMDTPAPAFSGGMDSPAPVSLDEPQPTGALDTAAPNLPSFDDAVPVTPAPSLPDVAPWATTGESSGSGGPSRAPAQPVRFEELSAGSGSSSGGSESGSGLPSHQVRPSSPASGPRKVVTSQAVVRDPFATSVKDLRALLSDEAVKDDLPTKDRLRKLLVTDESIKSLWDEINATTQEVVESVRGSFSATEEMLGDLQRARMLLMADEANFDNAEQILRNVQARLRREEKVRAWAKTRGTWLAIYLIGWMFLLAGMFAFNNGVQAILLQVVPEWLAYVYLPAIFGGMGGVIGALWVLIKHTAQKRDFDPIHTNWYVTNPFMGLALGLLAYLLVLAGGSTFSFMSGTTVSGDFGNANMIIYLICFIVGFNQNLLWRLIDQFIKSITPEEDKSEEPKGPSSSPEPGSGGD